MVEKKVVDNKPTKTEEKQMPMEVREVDWQQMAAERNDRVVDLAQELDGTEGLTDGMGRLLQSPELVYDLGVMAPTVLEQFGEVLMPVLTQSPYQSAKAGKDWNKSLWAGHCSKLVEAVAKDPHAAYIAVTEWTPERKMSDKDTLVQKASRYTILAESLKKRGYSVATDNELVRVA